ncbi:MAG: PQQ-dependent sugar dehydrogenase [Cyclobacteriaceae bacterium]
MNALKTTTVLFLTYIIFIPAFAQDDKKLTKSRMEVAVTQPAQKDATDENVSQLKLPAGFTIEKFAEDLGNSRMIAVRSEGSVYVTARDEGEVILLKDTNNDGKADKRSTVATIEDVHGIHIYNDNQMYLATVKDVYKANIKNDGTLEGLQKIIDDLPDGGQHPNRTLAVGPDNMLYISVGSTCNACEETNKEHATMLRAKIDGTEREVYAKGLRNTVGFAWHPVTKDFWGMDHNTDWLGDDEDHEDLNKIEKGKHYGWPFVYDDGQKMPHRSPPNVTFDEFVKKTTFPVLMYQPHSAPMEMVFYTGDEFPEEYKNDAFVAFRGSWNRADPTGYKVCRIKFDENNNPTGFEDFITGFLLDDGNAHFGRLVGLTVYQKASLLLTDDSNGVMYKISYNKGR